MDNVEFIDYMERFEESIMKGLWNIHCFYNSARYAFLKVEHEYNKIVETTGITLPQLRVLWIIRSFPGISLGEIAKIGSWSSPTVTKMLKILMNKKLVINDIHKNKKLYKLVITEAGEEYININKQGRNESFPLWILSKSLKNDEIILIKDFLKDVTIKEDNQIISTYIDNINKNALKIDYNQFDINERKRLEDIVWFYNLLRTFILTIEGEHRQLLIKYSLTYPQLRALWIIEAFPGITSRQLSEISFWSPSTANVIVKNLYEKELIYKEKAQIKNSLYLYISSKGEELIVDDFYENQNKLSISSITKISSITELERINSILKRINKCLGNEMVETYIEKTYEVIEKNYL